MRFDIKKHSKVLGTNILGKPVKVKEFYTIGRVYWGVFRFSVRFDGYVGVSDVESILRLSEVRVTYTTPDDATHFLRKEQAIVVLNDIQSNPDKYLRIYDNRTI